MISLPHLFAPYLAKFGLLGSNISSGLGVSVLLLQESFRDDNVVGGGNVAMKKKMR